MSYTLKGENNKINSQRENITKLKEETTCGGALHSCGGHSREHLENFAYTCLLSASKIHDYCSYILIYLSNDGISGKIREKVQRIEN